MPEKLVVFQKCLAIFTQQLAIYLQSIVICISRTSRCKQRHIQSTTLGSCVQINTFFSFISYVTYKTFGLVYKQDRQSTYEYNVTLRRVRARIFAVEKQ
jgi:hypothetical protein